MTGDEISENAPIGPALSRVLSRAGGSELLDLLVDGLSGADLTTLLLEVFRRRADRLSPAEVMRRYRADRFVSPASQRVVRAQHVGAPGMLAHFQLFGMVTAGRDTGGRAFEHLHLAEHLRFAARALSAAGLGPAKIRLTCLDDASIALLEHAAAALAATPGIDVLEDSERKSGRGYYTQLCHKVYATIAGQSVELADGGFVEWTQRFTGSRKERLLISGFGVDRLAAALPPPTAGSEQAAN